MINHEDQLKLQAYLDGELSEAEASEVANGLAQNQEAAALLAELRHTQGALAGFEEHIKLPESREFYWSKIQRQINAAQPAVDKGGTAGLFLLRFRRLLVPLTGVALVAVAALITLREFGPESVAVETSLADSGAMVYHDYSAGATFVWLSYPADNEMADNDDLDTFD